MKSRTSLTGLVFSLAAASPLTSAGPRLMGAGQGEWRRKEGAGVVLCSAPSVPQPVFTITEKAPTRAFSWLKEPTSAFTFKTLLRHYAKQTVTPW